MKSKRHHAKCVNTRIPPQFETRLRTFLLSQVGSQLKLDYLVSEVFKKFVSSETDPADVRRQRAINKWLSVEQQNQSTNERLLNVDDGYHIMPRVTWASFRDKVSSIVESVIGTVPPDEVLLGGFSGGASTSRLRACSHPADKFVGEADVTPRALDHAISLLVEAKAWLRYGHPSLRIVDSNVLFTVDKSTVIDRCAAKEPDLNMYMQKGVGNFFRDRLRRHGIDLNDQSRNRGLARLGSLNGSLATLDLSSASDSVTTQVVFEFLPICWYGLLSDLRSESTDIDGEVHVNQMFSSMGNGFTFELESLLFYAIARSVAFFLGASGHISVYGDDIICPVDMSQDLMWVLSFLGFSPNEEKSHTSGGFRESCGGHYFYGSDVTPFYINRPIELMTDLIEVLNKIRNWSDESLYGGILDPSLEALWLYGKGMVPRRLWGGTDLGSNSQLVTPHDLPMDRLIPVSKRRSTGVGGYIHRLSVPMGLNPMELSERVQVSKRFRYARVKTLDSKAIPEFLSEISRNPE